MVQRVRTIVDCGSGEMTVAARRGLCFYSLSPALSLPLILTRSIAPALSSFSFFFSRFSETVSCTRFWVIYFYGFERGDGVEKERKKKIHARTHALDTLRGKKCVKCVSTSLNTARIRRTRF